MALVLNPLQARQIIPQSLCSPSADQDCSFIRSLAEGSNNESVEAIVNRLSVAIFRIQTEQSQDYRFDLDEPACTKAALNLKERQIKRVWIVLGYIFSFLIIPAILAYQAQQSNVKLQRQIQELYELSRLIKQHKPRETLEALRVQLEGLAQKVRDLELSAGPETEIELSDLPAIELENCQRNIQLSLIDAEIVAVEARIKKLLQDHSELKAFVPESELPEMPSSLLDRIETDLKGISSQSAQAKAAAKAAALKDSRLAAERDRDLAIIAAKRNIEGLVSVAQAPGFNPLAPASSVAPSFTSGIYNGGNTCYMASVIQMMRFNPVSRYLIKRQLPGQELEKKDEVSGLPIFKKDTLEMANYRKRVQLALRGLLGVLDYGKPITAEHINAFRDLLAAGDSRNPSPWNQKDLFGFYAQQDAQEFMQYVEDLLLKSTISNPLSLEECFASGLQEEIQKDLVLVPSRNFLDLAPGEDLDDVYLIQSCIESNAMHGVELPYQENDFGELYVCERGQIAPSVAVNEISDYRIGADVTSPELEALRARLKDKTDAAESGVVIEKEGEYYRVGQLLRVEKPFNHPPSLTVHVKRFAFTEMGASRISGPVGASEFLNVRSPEEGAPDARYELKGCVCHIGEDINSGHYIAYTKINGKWYCFDDGLVLESSQFNPETDPDVYLLQYVKV